MTLIWQANHLDEAAMSRYAVDVNHFACASPFSPRTDRTGLVERLSPASLRHRIKPDLVQGMYLVQCGWTAAALGRPLVQFALGSDVLVFEPVPLTTPRKALGHAYRRWRTVRAVQSADAVLCDSAQVGRSLQDFVRGTRVEIVRISVELRNASSGREWRRDLGITQDAFVLLSTRLLTPNYNIMTIIRAFAIVLEMVPDCVLVLKDFESFGDAAYRASCHRLIRELGIANSVRNVGELERSDLLALYRAADVFVSVPTNDSTSVSVLEAMAASVPVVASTTAGMDSAVLRADESALLVIPGDSFGLADAIMRLYRSPALSSRLSQQGEETVTAIGDFDHELDRAEELFLELVERG